jgi:hypothetical protein
MALLDNYRGKVVPIGVSPGEAEAMPSLDWVIVGGESGHGARPFDVAWARSIVAQCQAAGVACFMKQLGGRAFDSAVDLNAVNYETHAVGAANRLVYLRLRQSKGGDMAEWPSDLRVRNFPEVAR